jgi:SAM-dependent methyltransferase
MDSIQFETDKKQTILNREKLCSNKNLIYWYKCLYAEMFRGIENIESKSILEIGSGASPLKLFYPNITTSDVLPMDYLDYVFDAHRIHCFEGIRDGSLDIIILVNVMHHLEKPLVFLNNAAGKLRRGGLVLFAEPYISGMSFLIYRYLHPERIDLDVEAPFITDIRGPLTSSNQALPFLVFFKRPEWLAGLNEKFDCRNVRKSYFTSLAYMATGGISRRIPIPHGIYKMAFGVDRRMAEWLPKTTASFFIGRLLRR